MSVPACVRTKSFLVSWTLPCQFATAAEFDTDTAVPTGVMAEGGEGEDEEDAEDEAVDEYVDDVGVVGIIVAVDVVVVVLGVAIVAVDVVVPDAGSRLPPVFP